MNKISQKRVKKYNANRFTACLLTVLMLFSALSTGSIMVHAETPVAQIVGGATYASLEAAVNAAGTPETPVEIELLANTALAGAVTIGDNITLDLNGKTLDLGSYNLTLSTSGKVVDNSGAGLLKTNGGKFNSSTQMAVYNTTKSGYVVADIKHQEAILSEASTGTFKLVFKPDFGTTANSLLGINGTDAKVSIQILLSWDGGSQTFTYTSDMIKDVYANSGKAFYITVTNFTNVANVKATPQIVSDLGADCRVTAHTLTAATVAVESVDLNKSSLELAAGSTETLTATVTPDNATDKTVTWTSSEPKVATVDANGKVTAVAVGTATITATTSNEKTATCTVTVKPRYVTFESLNAADWVAPTDNRVSSKGASASVDGETIQLTVTGTGTVGQATYNKRLGTSDILCFQHQIETNMNNYYGFAIAQNNTAGCINDGRTTGGYFIAIYNTYVQLQKRNSDNTHTDIITKQFNASSVFGAGKEFCDIEIGAINYPDGSVGIHFKINDTLIFDPEVIVDDSLDEKVIEGNGITWTQGTRVIKGEPVTGEAYFGVFVRKAFGKAYLKKADLSTK